MHYNVDHNNDSGIDDIDLLDHLPQELAALILSASAESSSPSAAPTNSSPARRYYPSYADGGESCSTKSIREFSSWEVSYNTLHECCNESFGWDYDVCMDGYVDADDDIDLLDLLPRELAALIASVAIESSSLSLSAAPTTSSTASGYYPNYVDGGGSCSTKSSSEFNSWEVQYDTLDGCCSKSFGWDYDACMNRNAARI